MTYRFFGDRLALRGWNQLVRVVLSIATVIAASQDKLPFSDRTNKVIVIVATIVLANHNAPVGRFVDPRHEEAQP